MTINCMTATQISGANVVGADGKVVARITEIMFDTGDGRILYAALAVGGIFGWGERLFAMPWAALHYDAADAVYRINATIAQFAGHAGFDKDAWPCAADPRLAKLAS